MSADRIRRIPGVHIHESAYVDGPVEIGRGTRIWHFCHIQSGAMIGAGCVLGQNVYIGESVTIGNNVKIQNNVSVFTGCEIEDDVFLGPSCVMTNITNPRSEVNRHSLYERTLIQRGATVGANATVLCGVSLGRFCFVAAGSVVTADVPDYALVLGAPARQRGWVSRHGHPLGQPDGNGLMVCPESGFRYLLHDGRVSCLDLEETAHMPPAQSVGKAPYQAFKKHSIQVCR
jgi:UDP-2-acetamido-3-amino-2,3-dideoxy-glucuronate N-acetyltransferase